MKKFLAIGLFLFPSLPLRAEVFGSIQNQFGYADSVYDAGCDLVDLDNTQVASTFTTPAAIYWVAISSTVDGRALGLSNSTSYTVIRSSGSGVAPNRDMRRIVLSSATNVTYEKFKPPILASAPWAVQNGADGFKATYCVQFVSTTTYRQFNTPVDFNGNPIAVADAGCVPTFLTETGAVLITTTATRGLPPASSNSGTVVYWVHGGTAPTAGIVLHLRSTDTANVANGQLMIPGITFNQLTMAADPVPPQGAFNGTGIVFEPPFRSSRTISVNITPRSGNGVTICTRGILPN